jgi:hypothetical protein
MSNERECSSSSSNSSSSNKHIVAVLPAGTASAIGRLPVTALWFKEGATPRDQLLGLVHAYHVRADLRGLTTRELEEGGVRLMDVVARGKVRAQASMPTLWDGLKVSAQCAMASAIICVPCMMEEHTCRYRAGCLCSIHDGGAHVIACRYRAGWCSLDHTVCALLCSCPHGPSRVVFSCPACLVVVAANSFNPFSGV